jgi:hypothetical protein
MNTPRTDAKAKWILSEFGPRNNGRFHMMSDHARSLECELADMTIERDKLLKACQDEKAKSVVDKILAERKLAAAHDVLKSCKNLIDQNRGLTLCQGSEWVSLLKDIDQAIK